jgi:hypothetical protein
VGVFQQIAPPQVSLTPSGAPWSPGGIASVSVDLMNPTTVYAGADTQGIFRSTDCGTTWTKVDSGRNSATVDSGTPWTLLVDPRDSSVLYATSMYGSNSPGLFKSTNAGADWDVVYPNAETAPIADWVGAALIDPTDSRHLLLAMHMNCKGAYAPACIGESTDAGATWRMIKVPTGGWSHNANMFPLTATTWMYGAGADGLFLTEDAGATWQKVADNAMNQMYQATDGSTYVASLGGLRRSTDLHAWTTLPNTRSIAVIGDGKYVYASDDPGFKASNPIRRALETDPMTWTALTSPAGLYGANMFSYDPDHHILYMPSMSGGLWRMVTY